MGRIRLLSQEAINRIAAGEVVESAASVVKELVENAVDAGAHEITIEVRGGGLDLIRIRDDGCGMEEEDALLAFERYATSKIASFEELLSLTTLGFRGEALSSIAAISRIRLETSTGKRGVQIDLEGGKFIQKSPCAHPRGTTIEVQALFHNVPARRAFQKSATAQMGEIERTCEKLALAHLDVSFELIASHERIFHLPKGGSLRERAARLLGSAFQTPFEVNAKRKGMSLEGLLAPPTFSQRRRTCSHLFVNGRPILSPLLIRAVQEGYGSRISEGSYPLFLLHLHLGADLVDVNVHPQKREVRFQDDHSLFSWVRHAVHEALGGGFERSVEAPAMLPWEAAPLPLSLVPETTPVIELPLSHSIRPLLLLGRFLLFDGKAPFHPDLPELEALLIVDLQAVQAELLMKSLQTAQKTRERQALLFPVTLQLTESEERRLTTFREELITLGFQVRQAAKGTFFVEALPEAVHVDEVKEVLLLLAEMLEEGDVESAKLLRIASKVVQKRDRQLSLEEASGIVRRAGKAAFQYMRYVGMKEMDELFSKAKF